MKNNNLLIGIFALILIIGIINNVPILHAQNNDSSLIIDLILNPIKSLTTLFEGDKELTTKENSFISNRQQLSQAITLYQYSMWKEDTNDSNDNLNISTITFNTNNRKNVNKSKITVIYEKYRNNGSTTNLDGLNDSELTNLSDFVIESTSYGKIEFNNAVNLSLGKNISNNETDLDYFVNISANYISINSSALKGLNKSAKLSIYGLGYSNPQVYKDGVICLPPECVEESYIGGIVKFNVSGFSAYSIGETIGRYTMDMKMDNGPTISNAESENYNVRTIGGSQAVSRYLINLLTGRFGILEDNNEPTIPLVFVPSAVDLKEGPSNTNVSINFTVIDLDGVSDLNTSSVIMHITKIGEETRSNLSCEQKETFGNYANFSCIVDMWWFDGDGVWIVNASIKDLSGTKTENSSETLTVNPLTGMRLGPDSILFDTINAGVKNTTANNDPIIINNTGNQFMPYGGLEINATNLRGELDNTRGLWSGNFSVGNSTGSNSECYIPTNATRMNVTAGNYATVNGAIMQKGNYTINDGRAQEELYVCLLEAGQDLTPQAYSTLEEGSWTIRIN